MKQAPATSVNGRGVKTTSFSVLTISLLGVLLGGCANERYWPENQRWIGNEKQDWIAKYDNEGQVILNEYHQLADLIPSDDDAYLQALPASFSSTDDPNKSAVTIYPGYTSGDLVGLDPQSQASLDQFALGLQGMQNVRIEVTGHTNNRRLVNQALERYGNNQALSEARALVVADYLAGKLNLDQGSISHTGTGDRLPIAGNSTPLGMARNRRVEVVAGFSDSGAPLRLGDASIPLGFTPWWQPDVLRPMNPGAEPRTEDVETLYVRALEHSTQIEVFKDIPLIRETSILEAEGEFDPRVFLEGRFDRTDEPVGSDLQTGGADRFKEKEWRVTGGVRKKIATGGEWEVSQRIGRVDNNSEFFNPDSQGLTRLALGFTQPLLNGAGIEYNRSTVEVAKVDHEIAKEEFRRQVESHLLETSRAYWSLYLERASLLIKKRLVDEANSLVAELGGRRGIDTLQSQVARARAALGTRRAEVIRAGRAVRNAEAKIVSLVNDPELRISDRLEIVPKTPPASSMSAMSPRHAAVQALENRPEIDQAMKQLQAGMIRAKMSKNELLPALDFFIEGRLDGLDGDHDIGGAYGRQYDDGGPGYAVGLRFEMPLGNRTAKARYERRRLEVRQLTQQLRTTVETLLLEVQVSVREVNTAHRELAARYESMMATEAELSALRGRRGLAAGAGESISTYVERLLDAQERLADEQQAYLLSQLTYNVALANLDRAMGLLMKTRNIEPVEVRPEDEMPSIDLQSDQS